MKAQIAVFDWPFSGFWMSDKALVQQALASELANIVLSIDDNAVSFEFLRGFWRTIVREWDGIDRLRWVPLV
jgi:ribosomal RNA-processing protein 1